MNMHTTSLPVEGTKFTHADFPTVTFGLVIPQSPTVRDTHEVGLAERHPWAVWEQHLLACAFGSYAGFLIPDAYWQEFAARTGRGDIAPKALESLIVEEIDASWKAYRSRAAGDFEMSYRRAHQDKGGFTVVWLHDPEVDPQLLERSMPDVSTTKPMVKKTVTAPHRVGRHDGDLRQPR
jgi:hypothetical protein